jgi:hypothetical protein
MSRSRHSVRTCQGVIGIGQDFSTHRKAFVDAAEQHERLLDALQTSAIVCVDADGVRRPLRLSIR